MSIVRSDFFIECLNKVKQHKAKLFQFQLDLDQFPDRLQVGFFPHFGGDRPERAPALGVEERILQLGGQRAGADGGFGLGGEIERNFKKLVPGRHPENGIGFLRHLAQPGPAVVVVAPIDRHLRVIVFQQRHESVPGGLGAAQRPREDRIGRKNIGIVQEGLKHGGTLLIIIQQKGRKSKWAKDFSGPGQPTAAAAHQVCQQKHADVAAPHPAYVVAVHVEPE
jgi:hypothetical protein